MGGTYWVHAIDDQLEKVQGRWFPTTQFRDRAAARDQLYSTWDDGQFHTGGSRRGYRRKAPERCYGSSLFSRAPPDYCG